MIAVASNMPEITPNYSLPVTTFVPVGVSSVRSGGLARPDGLERCGVAGSDLDLGGRDQHAGLPRPTHVTDGEVGFASGAVQRLVGVVVDIEVEAPVLGLESIVDLLGELAGEDLECTLGLRIACGDVMCDELCGQAALVVGAVVEVRFTKGRSPPRTCRSAGIRSTLDHFHDVSVIVHGCIPIFCDSTVLQRGAHMKRVHMSVSL